jgi:hypothetical protein
MAGRAILELISVAARAAAPSAAKVGETAAIAASGTAAAAGLSGRLCERLKAARADT